MRSQLLHPHAKINLGLRILGRRSDGYHEIRTRFQTISLTDEMEIARAPQGLELRVEGAPLTADRSNLVIQAAEALREGRRGLPGARIRLVKAIPVSSGLGGGSSDAAAALLGLNHLWGLHLESAELHKIAARLGADVPFFLEGGTALGEGRGDVVQPLPDPPLRRICLVLPPFGISTADAYRQWDLRPAPAESPGPLEAGWPEETFPAEENPQSVRNDLQDLVFAQHPELGEILRSCYEAGSTAASLSGSGSSLFALFPSEAKARQFRESREWGSFRVVECTSIGRRAYPGSLGLDTFRQFGSS